MSVRGETITVPIEDEMYGEVQRFIEDHPGLAYDSVEEFVLEAIRCKLLEGPSEGKRDG